MSLFHLIELKLPFAFLEHLLIVEDLSIVSFHVRLHLILLCFDSFERVVHDFQEAADGSLPLVYSDGVFLRLFFFNSFLVGSFLLETSLWRYREPDSRVSKLILICDVFFFDKGHLWSFQLSWKQHL